MPAQWLSQDSMMRLVVACCLLFLGYKAAWLLYPDLVITYPFITYDGYEWVGDGLHYAGHDTPVVYRNPGLPLVIAALAKLGLERLLPLVHVALLALFFWFLAKLLSLFFRRSTVLVTCLALFFNFKIQNYFDHVIADPWALTCQTISLYCLLDAFRKPWLLVWSLAFAAISFQFQYSIAFTFPAYLLALWQLYRTATRPGSNTGSPAGALSVRRLAGIVAVGVLVAACIALPPFVHRYLVFGNPLHSGVVHFPLLGFHVFGVAYYLFGYFAFFGIPFALLALLGVAGYRHRDGRLAIVYLQLACVVLFWVFLYQWLETRFILYMVPAFAVLFAGAVERLDLPRRLDWHRASWPKRIAMIATAPLLLGYGWFNQGSAFTANLLPLAPRLALVTGTKEVTRWGGNLDLDFGTLRLRYYPDAIPGFSHLGYYAMVRRSLPPESLMRLGELERVRDYLRKHYRSDFRPEADPRLTDDALNRLRLQAALRATFLPVTADAPVLLTLSDVGNERPVLFRGKYYALVSTAP